MNKKSLYQRNIIYFQHAKSFEEVNPRMGYQIKNFGVQNIFKQFQQNKSVLSEPEKQEFMKQIQEVKQMKEKLGESSNVTKEEFVEFLSNIFNIVDEVDREGEITMKTAGSFRLIGDLIDILTLWGNIDEDWNKKSNNSVNSLEKYCKYKCVDIVKALKEGREPKRGGPKESQDDELNNELKALENESKQEKTIQAANPINGNAVNLVINQNSGDSDFPSKLTNMCGSSNPNTNNNPVSNQQSNNYPQPSISTFTPNQGTNYPNNYQQTNNFQNQANNNNLQSNNVNYPQQNMNNLSINSSYSQNKFDNNLKPSISQEFPSTSSNNRQTSSSPDNRPGNLSNTVISHHSNLVQKHEAEDLNQQFAGININSSSININTSLQHFTASRANNTGYPNVNPVVTNLIKPPNVRLPVSKENKADYDKVIKAVLQHIEYGGAEVDYQKIRLAADHVEMAIYYLKNIQN